MPRVRRPPPPGILNHLLERYRDGRISSLDFVELKHWLESDPEVPEGPWYKKFKNFTRLAKASCQKHFSPLAWYRREGRSGNGLLLCSAESNDHDILGCLTLLSQCWVSEADRHNGRDDLWDLHSIPRIPNRFEVWTGGRVVNGSRL
jgi:hypothetical protein